MNSPLAESFLRHVWGSQGKRGWVFLSYKDSEGTWHDNPMRFPGPIRLPNHGRDVYFCPTVFKSKSRRDQPQGGVPRATVWLHADLDEIDPTTLEVLPPTAAWETSPGRYQCLWRVEQGLTPKQFRALNQRLTYLTGADKGGWSITKVLRVPGTVSTKRKKKFEVTELWRDEQHYEARVVVRAVKGVKLAPQQVPVDDAAIPDMTSDTVLHKYAGKIPKRAMKLLRTRTAHVGERSERLWELECLLVEAGMPVEEVFILVRDSVWNKFAGQRRELPQLWKEVNKAREATGTRRNGSSPEGGEELKFFGYNEFLATPTPTEVWNVEGIWSHHAHGFFAGEPKAYKSLLATDLAVSVASGTRFLGHFDVPNTGSVLVIQEENTKAMMKDRLEKIAHSRGINGYARVVSGMTVELSAPEDLPIKLMNNVGFNLTDPEHREFLEHEIQATRPALVVLDPLYLMCPGVDENSAVAMTPILRFLLSLKQRYDCGILIVHHYNKPREDEGRAPGHRLSGTNAFYRWFESAVYVEKKGPGEVKLSVEHRGSVSGAGIYLTIDMGEMGDPDYHVDVEVRANEMQTPRRLMLARVEEEPGVLLNDLADELGIGRDQAKRLAQRLKLRQRAVPQGGKKGRPPIGLFPPKA